mmetsp:Transcript_3036/g.4394  ORF Transcript_3036/g.4394 Transcript_3036/m.4394 type:complete len:418 (-) Transcript_3036:651-1904(-)
MCAYCELCDIQLTSINDYNAHICGKKHLKKERENDSSWVQKLYCEVCQCEMSSGENLMNHCQGRKHQKALKDIEEEKKIKEMQEARGTSTRFEQNGAPTGNDEAECTFDYVEYLGPKTYRCTLCRINVNSMSGLEQHMKGIKHMKKERDAEIRRKCNLGTEYKASRESGFPSSNRENCPPSSLPPHKESYKQYREDLENRYHSSIDTRQRQAQIQNDHREFNPYSSTSSSIRGPPYRDQNQTHNRPLAFRQFEQIKPIRKSQQNGPGLDARYSKGLNSEEEKSCDKIGEHTLNEQSRTGTSAQSYRKAEKPMQGMPTPTSKPASPDGKEPYDVGVHMDGTQSGHRHVTKIDKIYISQSELIVTLHKKMDEMRHTLNGKDEQIEKLENSLSQLRLELDAERKRTWDLKRKIKSLNGKD